jgi:hypothetical protein
MPDLQGWAVKTGTGFNRPGQYSLSGQYYYFKWKIVNFDLFQNRGGFNRPTLLVSGWSISKTFLSETAHPNEPKFGGKHLWKDLY